MNTTQAPPVIDARPANERSFAMMSDEKVRAEYVRKLFGNDADAARAYVCYKRDLEDGRWHGREIGSVTNTANFAGLDDANCFVANGLYTGGVRRNNAVEKIVFYIFDDIGTKVSYAAVRGAVEIAGIEVFAEIETSPGNETWIIRAKDIDTPEQIERYKALQRAFGARGWTDTAMRDSTRYIRLPWGVNTKEKYVRALGRAPKVGSHRLDAKARAYGVDELAGLLGIDLDAEIAQQPKEARAIQALARDGRDGYVHILGELGMVRAQKANGWIEIVCPWESEHSQQREGTAYSPGEGFKCQHGHCQHRNTQTFKDKLGELWRAEQKARTAAGTDGKAVSFEAALAAGQFTDIVPADGDGAGNGITDPGLLADIERLTDKLSGPLAEWLGDTVYMPREHRFFSLSKRVALIPNAHDVVWTARLRGYLPQRGGAKSQPMTPSEYFKQLPDDQKQIAEAQTYWPGRGAMFMHDGKRTINNWRPHHVPDFGRDIRMAEVKRWLKLVLFICDGKREQARMLIDMMARVIACPDWKPNFAIILKSELQGVGKDMTLSVLRAGVGHEHVSDLTPAQLEARFNSSLEKRVVIVNEMRLTTRGSRSPHDQYDFLKSMVGKDPAFIKIERKGMEPYDVPNIAAWFFTTNEEVPIALDKSDRRFYVIECTAQTKLPDAFYADVAGWLRDETEKGAEKVAAWLHTRGLTMSRGRQMVLDGNPPMTEAKADMIALSPAQRTGSNGLERWLRDEMPNWPDLMTLEDVKAEIKQALSSGISDLGTDLRAMPSSDKLGKLVSRRLGWAKLAGNNIVPMPVERGGKPRRVFAVRDTDKYVGMTRGQVAEAYAKGIGATVPKGLAHGSADGENVVGVKFGSSKSAAKVTDAQEPERNEQLPVAEPEEDYPF